jgi:hypothetical protein
MDDKWRLAAALEAADDVELIGQLSFAIVGKDAQRLCRPLMRKWRRPAGEDVAQELSSDLAAKQRVIETVSKTAQAAITVRPRLPRREPVDIQPEFPPPRSREVGRTPWQAPRKIVRIADAVSVFADGRRKGVPNRSANNAMSVGKSAPSTTSRDTKPSHTKALLVG